MTIPSPRLRRRHSPAFWVLRLLHATLAVLAALAVSYTLPLIRFSRMMNQVPSWDNAALNDEDAPTLVQLKEIAVWLLQYPPETRRRLIDQYDAFFDREADMRPALRIYVLLRLMFDLPESYPSGAVTYFTSGGWAFRGENGIPSDDLANPFAQINVLWPVGYKGDVLVLKGYYVGRRCYGLCSSGHLHSAAAFDWYSGRFRTRDVGALS